MLLGESIEKFYLEHSEPALWKTPPDRMTLRPSEVVLDQDIMYVAVV